MPQTNMPMLDKLLVGAFAYFAEDGGSIDEDTAPDVSADYEDVPALGCIEQAAFETKSEETKFLCPKTTGGYEETTETREMADYIDLMLQKYNELVHRLQFGIADEITTTGNNTVRAPFAKQNRKVRGWLCIHAVSQAGDTLLQMKVRAEVRLNKTPPWENQFGKPVFRFQVLGNSLNAIEFS